MNQIDICINRLKYFLSLNNNRFLLGITGGPGAGKSTFASFLVDKLNHMNNEEIAVVVPMDGFHLPNEVLHAQNIYSIKGKPETFDAERFVSIVRKFMTNLRIHYIVLLMTVPGIVPLRIRFI